MNTQNEQIGDSVHQSLATSIIGDMKTKLSALLDTSTKSDVYSQFEEATGLSAKSLRNWLSSKNLPYPQSIEAFYTLFLGIKSEDLPSSVLDYFAQKKYTLSSTSELRELSGWLKGKPLHTKIYRMLKIGYRVEKAVVAEYFGRVGIRVLADLEQMGLINLNEDFAKLASSTVKPSMNYFLACAVNHVGAFSFQEIKDNPTNSDSKFVNFIYEINKNDVSDLWQDLHQAQFEIFEKYSKKSTSETVVIETTTLLDQLNLNKKDIIQ